MVLRHIRVRGLYVDGGETGGQNATLIIDGDRSPDRIARRIVFDHVTVTRAGDSAPDIFLIKLVFRFNIQVNILSILGMFIGIYL